MRNPKRLCRRRIWRRIFDVCAYEFCGTKKERKSYECVCVCISRHAIAVTAQISRHSLMRLCVWPWVVLFRCFHWISSPLRRFLELLIFFRWFFAKVRILWASLSLFCSNMSSIYLKIVVRWGAQRGNNKKAGTHIHEGFNIKGK